MLRLRTTEYLGALVLGLALANPGLVQGQEPATQAPAPAAASTSTQQYDQLVLQALQAFDKGRWDEARRLFEQAHGLDPTARTLRTIGMAAFNQADYLAALQNLEASLTDPRKPLTDEQRGHVKDLIARANQQVGRFRLRVEPAGASLRVDGKSPVLIADSELVLLPGRHELVLSAPGYRTLVKPLAVEALDRALLELVLEPDPTGTAAPLTMDTTPSESPAATPVAPPTEGAAEPGAPSTEPASGSDAQTTWGIVALSIGGAGLVAAGVTTILALGKKSDLEGACPDRRCPPSEHDRVESYDVLRITSGVALGVGLAGAAVGTLLLVTAGGEGEAERAQVSPVIGPAYFGVRGRL